MSSHYKSRTLQTFKSRSRVMLLRAQLGPVERHFVRRAASQAHTWFSTSAYVCIAFQDGKQLGYRFRAMLLRLEEVGDRVCCCAVIFRVRAQGYAIKFNAEPAKWHTSEPLRRVASIDSIAHHKTTPLGDPSCVKRSFHSLAGLSKPCQAQKQKYQRGIEL